MSPRNEAPLENSEVWGTVLRIERTSIHDGMGLRTVVFLKGCRLRCAWCSTPESQSPLPEKGYAADRCVRCGACVDACPQGALRLSEDRSRILTDETRCDGCLICTSACPTKAMKRYGFRRTSTEVLREISKDEVFYFHSGGGITLSGGEPLEQGEFAKAILQGCRNRGIHRAMESCFLGSWKTIESLLPWVDLLYVDLKHPDSREHRRLTGVPNERILENLRRASASSHPFELVVRTPLIPGVNDSEKDLAEMARFARSLERIKEYEFLPYHRLGVETYRNLGRNYALKAVPTMELDQALRKAQLFHAQAPEIPVKVKGTPLTT